MEEIVQSWKKNRKSDYNENHEFLKSLASCPILDQKVHSLHEETFSKVDCLKCANCCRTTPALILKSDVKRLAKHLSIPPKTFIRKYLIEDINGDLIMNGVPCTFLNEDNTCQVYEVRPKACRSYPHTDEEGFGRRAKLNANNTVVCPAVFHIVNQLKTSTNDI